MNSRKQMPPMIPSKGREKARNFDFPRNSTTRKAGPRNQAKPKTESHRVSISNNTCQGPPNQAKPKTDSHRASISNKPSQVLGSSHSAIDPRFMASMKPSKVTAHPSPSPSRIMGPPPPRRVVASPSAQRSPKPTARAEPSRSAPSPPEGTYLREKVSSKPSSKATARPPRPVRPCHETATKKPSKSATSRPLPFDPNMFLAGKLADEYLKKGTLFGQPYVPTEDDFPPAPLSPRSTDVELTKKSRETCVDKEKEKARGKGKAVELEPELNSKSSKPEQQPASNVTYANVSKKLMSRALHIPGIVNPSQLCDFLNRHPEIE